MKYLLLTLIFLSCKKEPILTQTCYQCQLIVEGHYIANMDTCTTGTITAPQLVCKKVK